MDVPTLTISSEAKKGSTVKTRTFSVNLLGFLAADALWEPGGNGSAVRPVWLAYAATERESHPFTANLRAGRKAATGNQFLEIPRRAPHRFSFQKVPGGLVTVAHVPELFHLEPTNPAADPVAFVFAPPRWWVSEQAEALAADFGEDAEDAARAALFCAYLDRRTPLPLVHDLRFHLQLYRAARTAGWCHELTGRGRGGEVLVGQGAEASGLDAPLAASTGQAALAEFLIAQTQLYHQEEIRRGKTRIAASRRLLPYPPEAPVQLRLDLALA
jgi:hypothetical protein